MSEKQEMEQMKKDFQFTLSKISHEVRNPVTLISNFLQMMADKNPQVEQFDYWEDIQENMTYLKSLLDDLSTYNNASRLERTPLDLRKFTEAIANSLRPSMTYLGIELAYAAEEAIPPVDADAVKLREAILNILRNAWESIDREDGRVEMSLRRQEENISLAIWDNGPGIPPEYIPTLFDPFVTHKKEGTGLGLAIAKQVIEAHGGTIGVTSSFRDGTAFTLTLPLSSSGTAV